MIQTTTFHLTKMRAISIATLLIASSIVLACKKAEELSPIQDNSFEIKFSSDGMADVNAQFGISEKSQRDPSWDSDILWNKLNANVRPNGSIVGISKYRTGDIIYLYIKCNNISAVDAVPPAGNGFLSASLYINNKAIDAIRLGYSDYYNNPKIKYTDTNGKTNLIMESIVTIP